MKVQRIPIFFVVILIVGFAEAEDGRQVAEMQKQLEHVSNVNFHPNLLPLIVRNSDFIGLSEKQVAAFKAWGQANLKPMIATMNAIIRKRIEFQEAALSPRVSGESLRRRQEEIFQLHRQLLDYKLSCRKNIVDTFDEENWDGFLMVLGEEGYPIPDKSDGKEFAQSSFQAHDAEPVE